MADARMEREDVTAIDIALEPDPTTRDFACEVNARLREGFPNGYALGEDHHPHVTVLQRFVASDALDIAATIARNVVAEEDVPAWNLTAIGHHYIAHPPVGLAAIVIEAPDELHRLQRRLIDSLAPYVRPAGMADAFASIVGGSDIQEPLIGYVTAFVPSASGAHFRPHISTGVGTIDDLDRLLAEPFQPFDLAVADVTMFQIGTFGTARRRLHSLL